MSRHNLHNYSWEVGDVCWLIIDDNFIDGTIDAIDGDTYTITFSTEETEELDSPQLFGSRGQAEVYYNTFLVTPTPSISVSATPRPSRTPRASSTPYPTPSASALPKVNVLGAWTDNNGTSKVVDNITTFVAGSATDRVFFEQTISVVPNAQYDLTLRYREGTCQYSKITVSNDNDGLMMLAYDIDGKELDIFTKHSGKLERSFITSGTSVKVTVELFASENFDTNPPENYSMVFDNFMIYSDTGVIVPSPTPTPEVTHTSSVTPTPEATKTPAATRTPSVTRSVSVTPEVTSTPEPTVTPTSSSAITPTPDATRTPSPSVTPEVTSTPEPTMTPTVSAEPVGPQPLVLANIQPGSSFVIDFSNPSDSAYMEDSAGHMTDLSDLEPDDGLDYVSVPYSNDEDDPVNVYIHGDFNYIKFYDGITEVSDWGSYNITNIQLGSDIVTVPNYIPETMTDLSRMFSTSNVFNQDISSWNTSKVTNMIAMFNNSWAFDQDISSWDTSNVTNMRSMFNIASAFNQNISDWNVSNVTDMNAMFKYTSAFNQDISSWDVSNVTDMYDMFYYASAFNQDLSPWCVENITTEPDSFSSGASSWVLPKPVWGTCPNND